MGISVFARQALSSPKILIKRKSSSQLETIRATVVGAGSHTTDVSGAPLPTSLISFLLRTFQFSNYCFFDEHEDGRTAADYQGQGGLVHTENEVQQVALAINGESPSFARVLEYERLLSRE